MFVRLLAPCNGLSVEQGLTLVENLDDPMVRDSRRGCFKKRSSKGDDLSTSDYFGVMRSPVMLVPYLDFLQVLGPFDFIEQIAKAGHLHQ